MGSSGINASTWDNLKTCEGVFKNTAKKTKITISQSCCTSTTDCSDCCSSCRTMCLKTLSHCLKKGGAHAEGEHIQLLLDCITICQACSDLSARGSSVCLSMCKVCSETCARCAKSCDAL